MIFAAWCLFLLAVAAMAELRGDDNVDYSRPFTIPGTLDADLRWDAVLANFPAAAAVEAAIAEDCEGKNLVHLGENLYGSIWSAVDRLVQQTDASPLRLREDAEAPLPLAAARRTGDFGRVLAVCRRYPWAAAVHAALLDYGEQMLREGQIGLALRCFQDVLWRSNNPAVRARAQAAAWLARAALATFPRDLDLAMRNVPGNAWYPWLGQWVPARTIQERLKTGMKPADVPPALPSLDWRPIELPPEPLWVCRLQPQLPPQALPRELFLSPRVQPVVTEDGLLVAGPNLLAWYTAANLKQPRWTHVFPSYVSLGVRAFVAPGPFLPAVVGGRVYTRWGIAQSVAKQWEQEDKNPSANCLKDIAALDAVSGQLLWATADDPAWQELYPVNDPAFAEGRIYVLAVTNEGEFSPLFLVALDARHGTVLWKRQLATGHTVLPPSRFVGRRRPSPAQQSPERVTYAGGIDVVHFGNAVTVAGGAVYCSTNMGLVARCDARDGLIEWIATYPQNPAGADRATLVGRQGTPPVVAGDWLVCTPRDTTAVFTLNCDSGAPGWKRTETFSKPAARSNKLPQTEVSPDQDADVSVQMLATIGDSVLLAAGRQIASLSVSSGKLRWARVLDDLVELPAWLVAGSLYVQTRTSFCQFDAAAGTMLALRPWQPPVPGAAVALRGNALLTIKPAHGGIAREDVPQKPQQSPVTLTASNSDARRIYPRKQPYQIDGDPRDWDVENTTTWKDLAGKEGKVWAAYDEANLYLGLSRPATEAWPRHGRGPSAGGDWLELQIAADGREVAQGAIGVDGQGRTRWEDFGRTAAPAADCAAVGHDMAHGRLTYEIAIPWENLTVANGADVRRPGHWTRLSVRMTPHAHEGHTGQPGACREVGSVTEELMLEPPMAEKPAR